MLFRSGFYYLHPFPPVKHECKRHFFPVYTSTSISDAYFLFNAKLRQSAYLNDGKSQSQIKYHWTVFIFSVVQSKGECQDTLQGYTKCKGRVSSLTDPQNRKQIETVFSVKYSMIYRC